MTREEMRINASILCIIAQDAQIRNLETNQIMNLLEKYGLNRNLLKITMEPAQCVSALFAISDTYREIGRV